MTTPAPLCTLTALEDTRDAHTLAGEHARLIRDLTRRTAPVLALLDARAWPHAELGALTIFLRGAVLRQVSDEEVHLFPHDSSAPPFAELSADHVRLHSLTTQLEKVHAEPCPRGELRALVDELLATVRRHLAAEEQVLAALPAAESEVPSAADMVAGSQAWLPDDTPVRIDLDSLPAEQATELCLERLLRLRPGQAAEVRSCDAGFLQAVARWLRAFDSERFGLDDPTAGDDHLLRVTCRQANAPAGIGYPG